MRVSGRGSGRGESLEGVAAVPKLFRSRRDLSVAARSHRRRGGGEVAAKALTSVVARIVRAVAARRERSRERTCRRDARASGSSVVTGGMTM